VLDYSRCVTQILKVYLICAGTAVVGTIASAVSVVKLLKDFIKYSSERSGFKFLFFNSRESIITFLAVVCAVVILLMGLRWLRNTAADIPYVKNKDFLVTTGIVVAQDAAGREDVDEFRAFYKTLRQEKCWIF